MSDEFRSYTKRHLSRNIFSTWISSWSITTWIIIVNIFCFIIFLIAGLFVSSETLTSFFALNANNLFLKAQVWTLITSMFLHAGFLHLFVNMFSLYFLGKFLEPLIGRKRFFWFYIISGIFAGLFFALLAFSFGSTLIGGRLFGTADLFAVGASGAIFGLAGVMAVLVPRSKVYLIAGPLVAIVLQVILEKFISSTAVLNLLTFFINVYIILCIFVLLSFNSNIRKFSLPIEMPLWLLPFVAIIPLMIIGFFIQLPIGNSAHLGGLLVGLAYGLYLKIKYKKKVNYIQRYFSG